MGGKVKLVEVQEVKLKNVPMVLRSRLGEIDKYKKVAFKDDTVTMLNEITKVESISETCEEKDEDNVCINLLPKFVEMEETKESIESDDESEQEACNVCEETFSNEDEFSNHKNYYQHWSCSGCEAMFRSSSLLHLHKEEEEHWSEDGFEDQTE